MSDQDTAVWAAGAVVTSPDADAAAAGPVAFSAGWFAPAAPPGAAEVARRRECVRRLQRFWAVVAQRDLPPPAAVFAGEFSGVAEAYLRSPDGAPLEQLRWWSEAVFPAVLSVVRAPDQPSALEIAVAGPLVGELDNPVRVVQFLPAAGHLAVEAPRQTSWPELSGLLAGWQPPEVAPGPPPGPPLVPPVAEQRPAVAPCSCTYGLASVEDGQPESFDPGCPHHGRLVLAVDAGHDDGVGSR